jgi:hypothetical protein
VSDEKVYPRVEVIQHDQLDEAQWLARKIDKAADGPVARDGVARVKDPAALVFEMAYVKEPVGPLQFRVRTIGNSPAGAPLQAVGTSTTPRNWQARLLRDYAQHLQTARLVPTREEALETAAKCKFYELNV